MACAQTRILIKPNNAIKHSLEYQLLDEGHSLGEVAEILEHETRK